MDIYKWTSDGRKVTGEDWNDAVDVIEEVQFGPETVDELPPPDAENQGRVVRLSTDGRLYICVSS